MDLERDHWLSLTAASFLTRTVYGEGASVKLVDVPELTDTSSPGQRIKVVIEVEGDVLGLEHTLVESYTNQIRDGQRLHEFQEAVRALLPGKLPSGFFTLAFATDAVEGITGTRQADLARATAEWVGEAALELAGERGFSANRRMTEPITGTLWFRRTTESHDLQFSRWVPGGLEDLREVRLVSAFESKLPKLASFGETGAQTCLVLEDADFSLANIHIIAEAGVKALAGFEGLEPTWIVVAETLPSTAFWSILYGDGAWSDSRTWQDTEIPIPHPRPLSLGDLVGL